MCFTDLSGHGVPGIGGHQFIKARCQGVLIRPDVGCGVFREQFRSRVCGMSQDIDCAMRRAQRSGAEIGQNGLAFPGKEDIARLDIQMDDVMLIQTIEGRNQSLKP